MASPRDGWLEDMGREGALEAASWGAVVAVGGAAAMGSCTELKADDRSGWD